MSQIQICSPIEEVCEYYEHTSDVDTASFVRAYELGYYEPRYALPAIPVRVGWHFENEGNPFYSSICFFERRKESCPCCGSEWALTAIIDFDQNRCWDLFLPVGQYVNSRQIDEGIAAAEQASIHGYSMQ